MPVNSRISLHELGRRGRWRRWRIRLSGLAFVVLAAFVSSVAGAENPTRDAASAALKRAVAFFGDEVSAQGGYLWRYSADLSRREGEGQAGRLTAWVQPPGTPTVGEALLEAFQLTGEARYLEAARDTALALVQGQLQSGGWDYRIEFDPADRQRYRYRVEESNSGGRNVTTLDDDTTQSALRFLMKVDRALEFRDGDVHQAAVFGLDALMKAQYPNGAWPQRFSAAPDAALHPVKAASYPQTWSREWPRLDYRGYYTFNDNTIADTIDTMFAAAEIYNDARYRTSAEKAGGFILLAQMPEPQPAWAQQYNADMHPAWARKFEPPAITGGESQGVLRTLLSLCRRTGDRRFLEPVPRAVAYLKKSQLADGRLARFYELQTNRPLFFTRDYELTYSSDDLPTHYGFLVSHRLESIQNEYKRLSALDREEQVSSEPHQRRAPRMTSELADRVRSIIDGQDGRGAWVENGRLRTLEGGGESQIITSRTFCENVRTLSRYIAAYDDADQR